MIASPSVRAVLDEAVAAGALSGDGHGPARDALAQAAREHLPWYLRVLVGMAAWVGALFLLSTSLGLIAAILGERVDGAAMLLGIVLMPAGVRLRARSAGALAGQAALVCVIAGQLLLVGGLSSITGSTTAAALLTIASSALLIVAFEEGVYRFLATLAIVVAVLAIALEWQVPFALGLVTVVVSVVPVAAWHGGPVALREHARLDPVAWACVVAMGGLLLAQATIDGVTGRPAQPSEIVGVLLPALWPLTLLYAGLLAWLCVRVAQDHGNTPGAPGPSAALVAALALCLVTLPAPGVPGAVLLVVFGFDRRRVGLAAIGAAFLVAFLGRYYYSLSLTLLQKSALLVASGGICLAAARYFGRDEGAFGERALPRWEGSR